MLKKHYKGIIICLALVIIIILAAVLMTGCNSSPSEYMLSTSIDPVGAGTVTPERDTLKSGTQVTVTANPLPGYKFDSWSGDLVSNSSSATIIMDKNKNLVAHFKAIYKLTVSIDPVDAGTTNISSGTYDFGTSVNVEAKPNAGYVFSHWSGDVQNSDNPQSVLMNANKELVAHFDPTEINVVDGLAKQLVSIVANGNGTLESIDVTITSQLNTPLTVNIPSGIVFTPGNWAGMDRYIVLDSISIQIAGKESKQLTISTSVLDNLQIAAKDDKLIISNTPAPNDINLILKTKLFQGSTFREKQFAIWAITINPNSINQIKLAWENSILPRQPQEEEINQINNIFKEAGIGEKYHCNYVNYGN